MDITKLSATGLLSLHDGVRRARDFDDANPGNVAAGDNYFGVRQFADWGIWRDALEAELTNRGITFTPVTW